MNRDSVIAVVGALGCHALVLFSFQGPASRVEKSEGADSYMEVSLIASAPETVVAEAPQVTPAVPEPVIPVEPVPEPIKPEQKPEPIIEPKKEAVILPAEPAPPVPTAPVQQVPSATSETRATELATQNLPTTNNSSVGKTKTEKFTEPSVPQIAASYVKHVKPIYPTEAKRLQQEGTVLVSIYINASGKIDKVEILESSGFPLLDQAALEAAKRSRLRPAYIGDRPINSKVEAPYRFVLKE